MTPFRVTAQNHAYTTSVKNKTAKNQTVQKSCPGSKKIGTPDQQSTHNVTYNPKENHPPDMRPYQEHQEKRKKSIKKEEIYHEPERKREEGEGHQVSNEAGEDRVYHVLEGPLTSIDEEEDYPAMEEEKVVPTYAIPAPKTGRIRKNI